MNRDLYVVQNKIISKLYRNNLYPDLETNLIDVLTNIVSIEEGLSRWESKLKPELQLRPWTAVSSTASTDPVFERLSVIIRLRYLHARVLAHRVMLRLLSRRLEESGVDRSLEQNSFLEKSIQQSISSCATSAREIIEIVHNMSSMPKKLGSWWFTIYYSKCCAIFSDHH